MKRKIYFTLFIFFVAIIAFTINSEAAYQSRPNFSSLVNTTTNSFFENIRKMESADGPMGLNAEFTVSDTEVKETSASNNIDVHMIKNSEWGAAVLLASSGYGAGRDDDAGIWTTGPNNYTGIYGMGNSNWEYTASYCQKGGSTITGSTNYRSLLHSYQGTKYVDQYVNKNNQATADYDSFTVIKGDAIINVMNLHSRHKNLVTSDNPVFKRGNNGVFAFNRNNGNSNSNNTSRAVAVCGAGLLCEVLFSKNFTCTTSKIFKK